MNRSAAGPASTEPSIYVLVAGQQSSAIQGLVRVHRCRCHRATRLSRLKRPSTAPTLGDRTGLRSSSSHTSSSVNAMASRQGRRGSSAPTGDMSRHSSSTVAAPTRAPMRRSHATTSRSSRLCPVCGGLASLIAVKAPACVIPPPVADSTRTPGSGHPGGRCGGEHGAIAFNPNITSRQSASDLEDGGLVMRTLTMSRRYLSRTVLTER
jgi:hypothetical protein